MFKHSQMFGICYIPGYSVEEKVKHVVASREMFELLFILSTFLGFSVPNDKVILIPKVRITTMIATFALTTQ